MSQYVECQWFIGCHKPSEATVDHPTLGPVECCKEHVDWLMDYYSPTKMIPPILAAKGTLMIQLSDIQRQLDAILALGGKDD